jgi:hypothetical protein
MQSVVALRKMPAFHCSALVVFEHAPHLHIEICTKLGDTVGRSFLFMGHLDDRYHTLETTMTFSHYGKSGEGTDVPEIRAQCSGYDIGLGISKHEHGFSLRDSRNLVQLYYPADKVHIVLQTCIDACSAYPSAVRALHQAMDWVDAHK